MTLKIAFADFWPNFQKTDNYFYNLLSSRFEVVIDQEDPDLLFFSVDYTHSHERDKYLNHPCKKIFYTGENVRPNFDFAGSIEYPRYSIGKCDYAFSFDYSDDPRNYRLPLWVLFINWFNAPHREDRDQSYLIPPSALLNRPIFPNTKFCNFVFSNTSGKRIEILEALMCYEHVDSCGMLRNNSGYQIKGRGDQRYKVEYLQDYKFTIAAENTSYPGYTTEKILHPFSVGSIPIYWGSELVKNDFNADAFINVADYDSLEELVAQVEKIDKDDDLYRRYISAPVFNKNVIPSCALPQNVLQYFEENILC